MRDQSVTIANLERIIVTFTTVLTALTEQMTTLATKVNNVNNNRNLRRDKEENKLGLCEDNHDYRVKVDIMLFYRTMGVEEFLDWKIVIDRFFDVMGVPENKQVKMLTIRLKSFTEDVVENEVDQEIESVEQPVAYNELRRSAHDKRPSVRYP
ncbi:hypothetical protein KIW84_040674 [Lathyrus oleraceus]|uniref:Uncharacterized protein n=1 Tax=Pisum sativum TaxID=3888 RepID=A0A9D4X6M9_PEA|nr:hypothetical protein KIW84_040674 [Pisum sativum]